MSQAISAHEKRRSNIFTIRVSIGVSLDGVMVPMKDGDRQGKGEQAKVVSRTNLAG